MWGVVYQWTVYVSVWGGDGEGKEKRGWQNPSGLREVKVPVPYGLVLVWEVLKPLKVVSRGQVEEWSVVDLETPYTVSRGTSSIRSVYSGSF